MSARRDPVERPPLQRPKASTPVSSESLWWSLSPSGDRITICIPEDVTNSAASGGCCGELVDEDELVVRPSCCEDQHDEDDWSLPEVSSNQDRCYGSGCEQCHDYVSNWVRGDSVESYESGHRENPLPLDVGLGLRRVRSIRCGGNERRLSSWTSHSTLDLEGVTEEDENIVVSFSLAFDGDNPVLSSPKFLLDSRETETMDEPLFMANNNSPLKPRVRFAGEEPRLSNDQKAAFKVTELSNADGFAVHQYSSVRSHDEDDGEYSENVGEEIDRTVKEIYELRKLLAELKHDKLGLEIPTETSSYNEEFQFQPQELCLPETPIDDAAYNNSKNSRKSIHEEFVNSDLPKTPIDDSAYYNKNGSASIYSESVNPDRTEALADDSAYDENNGSSKDIHEKQFSRREEPSTIVLPVNDSSASCKLINQSTLGVSLGDAPTNEESGQTDAKSGSQSPRSTQQQLGQSIRASLPQRPVKENIASALSTPIKDSKVDNVGVALLNSTVTPISSPAKKKNSTTKTNGSPYKRSIQKSKSSNSLTVPDPEFFYGSYGRSFASSQNVFPLGRSISAQSLDDPRNYEPESDGVNGSTKALDVRYKASILRRDAERGSSARSLGVTKTYVPESEISRSGSTRSLDLTLTYIPENEILRSASARSLGVTKTYVPEKEIVRGASARSLGVTKTYFPENELVRGASAGSLGVTKFYLPENETVRGASARSLGVSDTYIPENETVRGASARSLGVTETYITENKLVRGASARSLGVTKPYVPESLAYRGVSARSLGNTNTYASHNKIVRSASARSLGVTKIYVPENKVVRTVSAHSAVVTRAFVPEDETVLGNLTSSSGLSKTNGAVNTNARTASARSLNVTKKNVPKHGTTVEALSPRSLEANKRNLTGKGIKRNSTVRSYKGDQIVSKAPNIFARSYFESGKEAFDLGSAQRGVVRSPRTDIKNVNSVPGDVNRVNDTKKVSVLSLRNSSKSLHRLKISDSVLSRNDDDLNRTSKTESNLTSSTVNAEPSKKFILVDVNDSPKPSTGNFQNSQETASQKPRPATGDTLDENTKVEDQPPTPDLAVGKEHSITNTSVPKQEDTLPPKDLPKKRDRSLSKGRVTLISSQLSKRGASSSPQPSLASIHTLRRREARDRSLSNASLRSRNIERLRSRSRNRSLADKNRNRSASVTRKYNSSTSQERSPKPVSNLPQPLRHLELTGRTFSAASQRTNRSVGRGSLRGSTNQRQRSQNSLRQSPSPRRRSPSPRRRSPSPRRRSRSSRSQNSGSTRGRTSQRDSSDNARKSRSRSVRKPQNVDVRGRPMRRSFSENAMKTQAAKPHANGPRSLNASARARSRNYELKVHFQPEAKNRQLNSRKTINKKPQFNLDLVKSVTQKFKSNSNRVHDTLTQSHVSNTVRGIPGNFTGQQQIYQQQINRQPFNRNLDSHFEENILLRNSNQNRGSYPSFQAKSLPNNQISYQNFYGKPMQKMRAPAYQYMPNKAPPVYGGGYKDAYPQYKTAIGAWFDRWNPFRNIFGGQRNPPLQVRPKYSNSYSKEFEDLGPRNKKPNFSRSSSTSKLFIQDPRNPNNVLVAEEVGYVLGDPKKIYEELQKKKKKETSYNLEEVSDEERVEKSSRRTKDKKSPPKSKLKGRTGFSFRSKTVAAPKKSTKSRVTKSTSQTKGSAKPKARRIRMSLSEIAKKVQEASFRKASTATDVKKAKFATTGKLLDFQNVASTAFKNKAIVANKHKFFGTNAAPKSILRGPPLQQYSTDPTAGRPVHFRPGTIPGVQEIPAYARGSPQFQQNGGHTQLPPQPNQLRLGAIANHALMSERKGDFFGRLHSGATRRQAEQSGGYYGPPNAPPDRIPVPSTNGIMGRGPPAPLPPMGDDSRMRTITGQLRRTMGDTTLDMDQSSPVPTAAEQLAGPQLAAGPQADGADHKVPIVLMQGLFNRAAMKMSLMRRAELEVEKLPLPPSLVEPTSMLRGALPVLPPSLASLCLMLNIFLPGIGTIMSGFMGLCWGRNRLAPLETTRTRGLSVLITTGTGLAQLSAVCFFLVGWFWSIAWGLLLVTVAQKYLDHIEEHSQKMTGAVGLEMMSVNTGEKAAS